MRFASLILSLALLAGAAAHTAPRTWRTGIWAGRTDAQGFVIDGARDLVSTGPAAAGDSLVVTDDTEVRYVVEQQTVVVLDGDGREHTLALREVTPKFSSDYSAAGGGHFVKSVSRGGRVLTLEDNSRWEVEPRMAFVVAEWEIEDLITVRRHAGDEEYAFTLDNTTRDDGVAANHRVR